ncbi:MAG: LTA synthase family protein [Endomicrobiales bacterium]
MILKTVARLLALNGLFLLSMSAFRLVFCLYYSGPDGLRGMGQYLVKAFVLGARFDLAVIAYVAIPVTLSLLGAWALNKEAVFRKWLSALKYYYLAMYALVFAVLWVDFGFYSYFKNHINILIFGIFEDDTRALMSTITSNYNVTLVLAAFAALAALIFFASRHFTRPVPAAGPGAWKPYPLFIKAGFALLLVAANALAARGSLAMFPLGTMDAEISPDLFINKLGINGVYALQDAIEFRLRENREQDFVRAAGYEGRVENAFADLLGVPGSTLDRGSLSRSLARKTPRNAAAAELRPNVVLIMMEGFGTDLLQYHSERFNVLGELKKHFDSDYLFTNFLSGDVGTIGSIEAVLLNLPKRPNTKSLSQSKYAFNAYGSGAALPFKNAGYRALFLYGGNIGWRGLLSFVPRLGFDAIEGEGAMDPSYLRNEWGVYDEFLFEYIYDKLSSGAGKPQFIFAMTTSNHPPYSLPPSYKQLPLEIGGALRAQITGDLELARGRFMTYQYANQRLGELISRIKASPLGGNTIVAVTGDHNFWSVFDYPGERYADLDGVPFYLYVPEALKPGKVDCGAFGSHIDIMPTLYRLSLSEQEYTSVGVDLLDGSLPHVAYNVDGILLSKEAGAKYSTETGTYACYGWDGAKKRFLAPCAETEKHRALVKRYRSALAVTDYFLKNPEKQQE